MTARNAALKTLVRITSEQAFSNLEVNHFLRSGKIAPQDRGLYVSLVYGTLQHMITIDHILKKFVERGFSTLEPEVLNALRLAVYQMFFLDNKPDYAVVNETVNMIKHRFKSKAGFVNGVLRNILRDEEAIRKEIDTTDDLELKLSVPEWIIDKYTETYGDKAIEILETANQKAPLTFRIKPGYYDQVFSSLEKLGAEPQALENEDLKDEALIVLQPGAMKKGIAESNAYKKGIITVQDQGAIEIAKQLDVRPGENVLDLCAAPGGKTTYMAQNMDNSGEITACDIHLNRLDLIKESAKRTGSKNITVKRQDATQYNPNFKEKFDKVLADVPCTGLGVLKRKPDIRYRVKKEDGENLSTIQEKILANAFEYTKPEGLLVYSTCTVGREENEDIIEAFLEKENKAELIKEKHTSPLDQEGDAFYYAVIKKNG